MPRIDNPIEPVRRLKISDSVAAQLEFAHYAGRIRSRRKAFQRNVTWAERFGVGRSTMREALRRVEGRWDAPDCSRRGCVRASNSKRPEHGRGLLLVDDEFTVPELFEVPLGPRGRRCRSGRPPGYSGRG